MDTNTLNIKCCLRSRLRSSFERSREEGATKIEKVRTGQEGAPIWAFCDNVITEYPLFKVSNGNPKTMCEICSMFMIKTPERRHWRRCGVFIVNFEQISHCSGVSIVDFEPVDVSCVFGK